MPHYAELDLLNIDPSHGTDIEDFSKPVKLYPVRRLQIRRVNMLMLVFVPLTLLFISATSGLLVRIIGVLSGHPESTSLGNLLLMLAASLTVLFQLYHTFFRKRHELLRSTLPMILAGPNGLSLELPGIGYFEHIPWSEVEEISVNKSLFCRQLQLRIRTRALIKHAKCCFTKLYVCTALQCLRLLNCYYLIVPNSHLPLNAEDVAQLLRERKSFAFSQKPFPLIDQCFLIDRRSV